MALFLSPVPIAKCVVKTGWRGSFGNGEPLATYRIIEVGEVELLSVFLCFTLVLC